MLPKLCDFLKKYRALVVYLLVGGLTTLVNFMIYLLLCTVIGLNVFIGNGIAWFTSAVFAFLLNKTVVFMSKNWSWKVTVKELYRFMGCRLFSGIVETVLLFFLTDMAQGKHWTAKILCGFVVLLLNYVGGRLFVFCTASE